MEMVRKQKCVSSGHQDCTVGIVGIQGYLWTWWCLVLSYLKLTGLQKNFFQVPGAQVVSHAISVQESKVDKDMNPYKCLACEAGRRLLISSHQENDRGSIAFTKGILEDFTKPLYLSFRLQGMHPLFAGCSQ